MVTDFDGNPVLEAHERMLPIPAALDVAGMTQSLAHAAIVAAKYTPLDAETLADGRRGCCEWRSSTRMPTRLRELGHADLYDPAALHPFRMQQVLREIIYAARHLPRWMYVPDSALPALLDEGRPIVKPDGFAADLYRKPEVLQRLAESLARTEPMGEVVPPDIERVVLLGMGSSAYAGGVAAARMRANAADRVLGTGVLATAARIGASERSSSRRRRAVARRRRLMR